MPLVGTGTPPAQWECRVCWQPAGTGPPGPLDPPPAASYLGGKSHLEHVKSRRSPAEGDALMAEFHGPCVTSTSSTFGRASSSGRPILTLAAPAIPPA